jgi:hypothetical protein
VGTFGESRFRGVGASPARFAFLEEKKELTNCICVIRCGDGNGHEQVL